MWYPSPPIVFDFVQISAYPIFSNSTASPTSSLKIDSVYVDVQYLCIFATAYAQLWAIARQLFGQLRSTSMS